MSEGEPGTGAPRHSWLHSRWFPAAAIVLGVVVIALAVNVPVRATSTSSYCSSCHQMKNAKTTWAHSPHSRVSCVACHVPPGLVASFGWRAREWVNIWATYLHMGSVSAKQQVPTNANCTSCHNLARLGATSTDIRMPHQLHATLPKLRCIDCHDKVSHGAPGQATTVSMAICSMCHAQVIAQNQCTFCHRTRPRNIHPANYIVLHGKEALANGTDCLRCHHSKQTFCDPCHAKPPADHQSATWTSTHAATAQTDPAICLGCHDQQTFCQRCHQVDHPANWTGIHGAVAVAGTAQCLTCHQTWYCQRCHAASGVKL